MFESFCDLGQPVEAGQPAGLIHFLDAPAEPPEPALFRTSGTLYAKRAFGRVERGSCVSVVVTDHDPPG